MFCWMCAAYLRFEDKAGLAGVSGRLDYGRNASATVMGRSGAPGWVGPISVPNQRLICPLRYFLVRDIPRGLRREHVLLTPMVWLDGGPLLFHMIVLNSLIIGVEQFVSM